MACSMCWRALDPALLLPVAVAACGPSRRGRPSVLPAGCPALLALTLGTAQRLRALAQPLLAPQKDWRLQGIALGCSCLDCLGVKASAAHSWLRCVIGRHRQKHTGPAPTARSLCQPGRSPAPVPPRQPISRASSLPQPCAGCMQTVPSITSPPPSCCCRRSSWRTQPAPHRPCPWPRSGASTCTASWTALPPGW